MDYKELVIPVLLQAAAIGTLFIEFLVPSAGILTLISVACFIWSLYIVFVDISHAAGVVFIMADLLVVPVVIYAGFRILERSSLTLKTSLGRARGVVGVDEALEDLVGMQGEVITPLRPSGTAMISGRRIDVVTDGEFIEKGTRIEVYEVEGNRVVVKKVD